MSKAISLLGGTTLAVFTSGGHAAKILEELVGKESITYEAVAVQS